MFEKGQKVKFLGVEAVVVKTTGDLVQIVYVDALGKILRESFTRSELKYLIDGGQEEN